MYYKAIVTKTMWYWHKRGQIDQRSRKDQKQTHTYLVTCDLIYVKGNIFAMRREKTFLENDAGLF